MANSHPVVLVTTTFSPSPEDLRFKLALKTVHAAHVADYPIMVVDGSPDESLRTKLEEAGATVFKQTQKGMGASRRQALRAGINAGAEVIVWLEPEKYPLVPLLAPCVKMVQDGYHIVIPTRESLESYPRHQELSELRANRELGFITQRPELDLMFGPRVMDPVSTRLLLDYTGKHGGDNWEILFIPILWALKQRLIIGQKIIKYVHPPEQTAIESGDTNMALRRDQQRTILVSAMGQEAQRLSMLNAI